jgi:hypothetical protein
VAAPRRSCIAGAVSPAHRGRGGAGSAFTDATGLPPLSAIAALHDADVVRRAARLTARELRMLGINWALGPVGDLDREPLNPLLGSRTFGPDAQRVAEWVVEWIDACQAEGVLACVRHFPGMGRAEEDPHLDAATVDTAAGTLWSDDLLPFRAAADTGVASIMAASVAYPRLDASGRAAARSRPMLTELLRGEPGMRDRSSATNRRARRRGDEEGWRSRRWRRADPLLAPSDLHGVLRCSSAPLTLLPDCREPRTPPRGAVGLPGRRAVDARRPALGPKLADTLVYPFVASPRTSGRWWTSYRWTTRH